MLIDAVLQIGIGLYKVAQIKVEHFIFICVHITHMQIAEANVTC